MRPYIRYFHSSQYISDLANGEICVAVGFSGDIFIAADRAVEAGNGIEIGYSIPKEGALLSFDMLAIPADAPHPENAHAFINFIMKPEITAAITNTVYYANANDAALPLVDPEIADDPAIYPDRRGQGEPVPRRHPRRPHRPDDHPASGPGSAPVSDGGRGRTRRRGAAAPAPRCILRLFLIT